ncbi:hypothetical protein [Mangrovimonas xylaniphaga]|uniref:hypothetical protein n=1 Tax=Mangrovimonas xylaniphaga TaxID=1645915 RepID=UPI0006B50D88|nr:hypothetical protein [Mangrovimonas xylaniphaga]
MKNNILEKIEEALASQNTTQETKKLLEEVKSELKKAKTEKRIVQLIAILIKIITGFFDD